MVYKHKSHNAHFSTIAETRVFGDRQKLPENYSSCIPRHDHSQCSIGMSCIHGKNSILMNSLTMMNSIRRVCYYSNRLLCDTGFHCLAGGWEEIISSNFLLYSRSGCVCFEDLGHRFVPSIINGSVNYLPRIDLDE